MIEIKNNNTILNYIGDWSQTSKNGEIIKLSATKGSYVELPFVGTGVRFYTQTNVWRGIANIYLDDVKQEDIDLYSTSETFGVLAYEKIGLENKEHTLKIEVSGNKNTNAVEGKIAISKFEVDIIENTEDNIENGKIEELNKKIEELNLEISLKKVKIEELTSEISNLQVQADLKLDEVKNIVEDLKGLIANA